MLRPPPHEDLGPLLGYGARRLTHVLSDELKGVSGKLDGTLKVSEEGFDGS